MTYVQSVSVTPNTLTLTKNEEYKASCTVCPTGATNKAVTWCSSDTDVASVDGNGNITAIDVGTTRIYATAKDGSGKIGVCNITVHPVVAESITLGRATMTTNKGNTYYPPGVKVLPVNATNKSYYWCSDNTAVVEIDSELGCITAKSEGTARIYAVAEDGSDVMGSCLVTVEPPLAVESVTVAPSSKLVYPDHKGTINLNATITPSNAGNKKVTWSTSDRTVATVNYNGEVTIEGREGTAIITAKTDDGNNMSNGSKVDGESFVRSEDRKKVVSEAEALFGCSRSCRRQY